MLASWGDTISTFSPEVKAQLAKFGAEELENLDPNDDYVLIAVKDAPVARSVDEGIDLDDDKPKVDESTIDRFAVSWETLVKAGAPARAAAQVRCPVLRYDLVLADGFKKSRKRVIASTGVGLPEITVPPDTEIDPTYGVFFTVRTTSLVDTTQIEETLVVDKSVMIATTEYVPLDPASLDLLAGKVTWSPEGDIDVIAGFNVYFAAIPDFTTTGLRPTLHWLGEGQPGSARNTYGFIIPVGTTKGNLTDILIKPFSIVGETKTATRISLDDFLGQPPIVAAVILMSSVAAVHAARIASSLAERLNLDKLEKGGGKMDAEKDFEVTIIDNFEDKEGNVASVGPATLLDLTGWRGLISPLFSCFHHHEKSVVVKLKMKIPEEIESPDMGHSQSEKMTSHQSSGKSKSSKKSNKSFLDSKYKLFRAKVNDNAWDNDQVVMKKVTNAEIKLFGIGDKPLSLFRQEPFAYRVMQMGFCSRSRFRMMAPMVTLCGVAVILLAMGDLAMGVILISLVLAGAILLFIASSTPFIKEMISLIQDAPPEKYRKKFWGGCTLLVGCMPMGPAFMSGTWVGYMIGICAVIGSVLSSNKAYGLAAMVEGAASCTASLFSMYQKYMGQQAEESESQLITYTAQFMASVLVMIKCIDSTIESTEMMFKKQKLPEDELVVVAESLSDSAGLSVSSALVMAAFAEGKLEPRMQARLTISFHSVSEKLMFKGGQALTMLFDELCPSGSADSCRWPLNADQLGYSVGRAIDAAASDLVRGPSKGLSNMPAGGQGGRSASRLAQAQQAIDAEQALQERLAEMEDSLKQMLNGIMATKCRRKYENCVKDMREIVQELHESIKDVERKIGIDEIGGRPAMLEAFGLYTTMLFTTATYVRQELNADSITLVDLRILHVKVAQMKTHIERVIYLVDRLDNVMLDPEKVERARQLADHTQEVLRALTQLLQGLYAPSLSGSEKAAVEQGLDEVLEYAVEMWQLREDSGEDNFEPQVDREATMNSKADLEHRGLANCNLQEDTVRELCLARCAVGLVQTIYDEAVVAVERAEKFVRLVGEARRSGFQVLHLVSQAREYCDNLSEHQVRKIQERVLQFTTGLPVQALVLLQESTLDATKQSFRRMIKELQNRYMALNPEFALLDEPATPTSMSEAGRSKKRDGRVYPMSGSSPQVSPNGSPKPSKQLSTLNEQTEAQDLPGAIRERPDIEDYQQLRPSTRENPSVVNRSNSREQAEALRRAPTHDYPMYLASEEPQSPG